MIPQLGEPFEEAGQFVDKAASLEGGAEDEEGGNGQRGGIGKDAEELRLAGERFIEGQEAGDHQAPEGQDGRQVRGDPLHDEADEGGDQQDPDKNHFP